MNKKGFTLVELLAVIAILAILVIIALPNVLKMFNDAKKNTFLTEAKTLYKEVSKKYITESMKGNKVSVIKSTDNKLDLQSANDLEYNIKLDNSGNVKTFAVGNDSYCINGSFTDINDLTIDKVTEGKCKDINAVYCVSNKTLEKGTTYVNGQFTYRYMLEYSSGWADFDEKITSKEPEGWGVILTDKDSTDVVNSTLCTYIDNKPVVSMYNAFSKSNATEIDLSNADTSKVISMKFMFSDAKAKKIILKNLDTKNVITMTAMFAGADATTIDLSGINTENVYNMSSMFYNLTLDTLDLSGFKTQKLEYTNTMFQYSNIGNINLSSFDTSNAKGMIGMFQSATISSVDLSNFVFNDTVDITDIFKNSEISTVYVKDIYIDKLNLTTKPSSLQILSK